jgi:DNA replication ATP-dependent helicase Dna2
LDLSLEQRLVRFLGREEEGERRSSEDLRAMPVEERVLEGECIQNAVFVGAVGADGFAFELEENASKFRPGDAVLVGDGESFEAAQPLAYGGYDARSHRLVLRRDRFAKGGAAFEVGRHYCVDRRPLGTPGRLQEVVRAGFAVPAIAAALHGELRPTQDDARYARAAAKLRARGLDPAQVEAGARAIACDQLALVQGPPGTGKTRVLAEIATALCDAGCRIALTAFTHRAVENVLLALRGLDPQLALVKLGSPGPRDSSLRAAGVRFVDPRHAGKLPRRGVVVAGTCFALAKLPPGQAFHYVVFDEAAQLPIPHAIAGMLLSQRWVMFGDHRQLPPVVTASHADAEVTKSVFEHLDGYYGSTLLNVTYRMNDRVCALVGDTFYGGALRPAPGAAARRLPFRPGGAHDEVLDPELGAVLARVDHLQPGNRSPEEANLIADLVAELLQRHGVAAEEIAVVAPFRAQVRVIRSALQRKHLAGSDAVVVDTVERIQGQEREVVLASLAVGDPDTLDGRAAFFFSTNRLNVALSRARTKVVVVASRGAFAALPRDPDSLRAADVFRRLYRALPQVDLTPVYAPVAAALAGSVGRAPGAAPQARTTATPR